jgi:hypothetical protein
MANKKSKKSLEEAEARKAAKIMIIRLHQAILEIDSALLRLDKVIPPSTQSIFNSHMRKEYAQVKSTISEFLGLAIEHAKLDKDVWE